MILADAPTAVLFRLLSSPHHITPRILVGMTGFSVARKGLSSRTVIKDYGNDC